jgi:predicted metalloprotease with PDZ domain
MTKWIVSSEKDANPVKPIVRGAWLVLAAGLSFAASPMPTPPPLAMAYSLTPEVENGVTTALDVAIEFHGDARGTLTFDLPDTAMGEKELWHYLSDFTAGGATLTVPDPGHRVLGFAPGADVVLRYRVHAAYSDVPKGADGNPYRGVVLAKGWFAALGEHVFIVPHDSDIWPATFRWGVMPKGWNYASDLEHGAMGRPMTTADIVESTMLGGTDVTVTKRDIPGGVLRLAMRGSWAFTGDHLADVLGHVAGVQRHFWGDDVKGPFLVTLFQLSGTGSSGGTGRTDAFALFGTGDITEASFVRTIAHEHMHSWIPARIGALPDGPTEPLEYWLSEGFTDFYAERTLLRSGIWSLEDFVGDVNDKLLEYDASPVREAPNARIAQEFWTNYPIEQLPYERGMLFAYLLDAQLRRASGGKRNLDTVMFRARDAFVAAPPDHKPDAVANFLAALKPQIDISADLDRIIEKGALIRLPESLFGACATIRTLRIASFDRGFDADKTAAGGHFTGVDPSGPAYAAGIREGMVRVAYVSGKRGDSRIDYVYRVGDGQGREWTVAYKPIGKETVEVQEVVLTPAMDPAQRAACVTAMSGS